MKKKTAIRIITFCTYVLMIFATYFVVEVSRLSDDVDQNTQTTEEVILANSYRSIVDGESMYPTFEDGDIIEVTEGVEPEYHDIVVFKQKDSRYVKRLIGLPGDTIEIKDGDVFRNGIKEPRFFDVETNQYSVKEELVVEEGHYFVLGDNIFNSYDSRMFGLVPTEDVVGTAKKIEDS